MMKTLIFVMGCVMLLAIGANAAMISNGDFESNTSNWASKNGQSPIDWFSSLAGTNTNGNYGEAITGYGSGKVAAMKGEIGNYYQQVLSGVDAGTTGSYTVAYDGGIRWHSSYNQTTRDITLRVSLWDTIADVELAGIDIVTVFSNLETALESRSHELSYNSSGLAGHDLAVRFTNTTVPVYGGTNGNTIIIDNVEISSLADGADLVIPIPNDTTHVNVDTLLEWVSSTFDSSTGIDPNAPTGYDVYIDPNESHVSGMDPLVRILDNKNQTSVDPVLDFETTYYWRVVTYHGEKATLGYVWSFTTATAEPVLLTSPIDQTVIAGEGAIFEVSGLNETGYNWYKSVDESNATIEDDTLISTAGPMLILSGTETQSSEEGFVYCELTNSGGAVKSDVALLMTKRQVAQWDMEGDLLDSVGINDGVDTTVPLFAADGVVGLQSLEVVPGDPNTYVTVPLATELNNAQSFTIEAWVKPTAHHSYSAIISNRGGSLETGVDGGYVIYTYSDGRVSFWLYNGSSTNSLTTSISNNTVTVGQWNYVVVTFENGVGTIYINGVQGSQVANRNITRNITTSLYIGAGANNEETADFYFDGLIDQVKMHTDVLDAYAVANNYVAQFPEVSICASQAGLTYDADGDCDVDMEDFALLASEWLNCRRVAGTESGVDNCN